MLRDETKFSEGFLDQLTIPGELSAMAFEPGIGLLAVGTSCGTVHVFGAPPARISITLRPACRVKHLLFKSDTFLLICIDEKDNISIYDMSRRDPHGAALRHEGHGPRRAPPTASGTAAQASQLADAPMRVATHCARNAVLCAEVTASHSHMFLGLADGTVDAYDLERFIISPYRVSNLWWPVEEALRRTASPVAPSRLHVPLIIDIKTNPRDMNLLLLCYEGGAVLYSVRDKSVQMTYELHLLPGAPGPDPRAPFEEIWKERLCPATSVAWHPDGAVFVMGHENGALSFWNAKDEDKPLVVRTLDQTDIERPTAPEDTAALPSFGPREPVFKLAWSAFPAQGWASWGAAQESAKKDADVASDTVLTMMGGSAQGTTSSMLHTFHMSPMPGALLWTSRTPEAAHKARVALQQVLVPVKISAYHASATIEDFVLLPNLSPHCDGAYDPYAVVVMVGNDERLPMIAAQSAHRGVESFSFPPRPGAEHEYEPLHLPLPLAFIGRGTVLGSKLQSVPIAAYRKLLHGAHEEIPKGSVSDDVLMGGYATPYIVGGTLAHAEGIARQGQPRILVTWHLDGTLRFHDASPHLLLMGEANPRRGVVLRKPFPMPLPHLTISVRQALLDPSLAGLPSLHSLRRHPEQIQICDAHIAWDAAEAAAQLVSGQIMHIAFATDTVLGSPQLKQDPTALANDIQDMSLDASAPLTEFTSLESAVNPTSVGFKPAALIQLMPGIPTCSALCDAGLLALASGALLVVADLRGQDVVVRAGFGAGDYFSRQIGAAEDKIVAEESKSAITSLTFSVCRTEKDFILAPRLLVGRANGFVTVWTFEHGSMDSWFGFRSDSVRVEVKGHHLYSAVLDPIGQAAGMTSEDVQRAHIEQESVQAGLAQLDDTSFNILAYVSERLVVLHDQITGARIARAELPENALAAHVVCKNNARVLIAVSTSSIVAMSLPRLDAVHRIQRHVPSTQEVVASTPQISVDVQGNFVELSDGQQLRLWTAFATLPHGEPPIVCMYTPRTLPLAPGEGAGGYIASLGGWLGTTVATPLSAGAQLDAVIAGPKRMALPKLPPQIGTSVETREATSVALPEMPGASNAEQSGDAVQGKGWFDGYAKSISKYTSGSLRSQASLNMQLLHKRDAIIADVGDGIADLERNASNFFKQTRNSAFKAAAKEKIYSYL
ncbi:hypothetical protein MVES_001922 [Malassezia vespertilionis]|uniref:Lethal giant larvae (Lgl)-like C-terminal domain-containing protein n=2 Tax=Malassezia vespertilionis TaxID=2020962 RepID=A0A2N1JBR3_9BASI|nr:hypothetical protein MVES_001922 [Malassezia vespertilionis]